MKEPKKKVLLIGPFPPPEGGVSIHMQRLLQKSVKVPGLELAVFDIGKRIFIGQQGNRSGVFSALRFFLSASIVHVHISHPIKSFIGRIVKLFGKKLFYTQHNPREENTPATKKIISISDKVIFVYPDGHFPGRIVIPAFIPPISISQLPDDIGILCMGRKVVVTMGSASKAHPAKDDLYGFDLILKSIHKISSDEKLLVLLVDVNGAFEERYRTLLLKVQEKAGGRILLKYISESIDFPSLLIRADVFIRSTRTDGDSIAVREALNAGARVVASDCVKRPKGCLLFKTGDADDLALKVSDALIGGRKVFVQDDYSDGLFAIYKA